MWLWWVKRREEKWNNKNRRDDDWGDGVLWNPFDWRILDRQMLFFFGASFLIVHGPTKVCNILIHEDVKINNDCRHLKVKWVMCHRIILLPAPIKSKSIHSWWWIIKIDFPIFLCLYLYISIYMRMIFHGKIKCGKRYSAFTVTEFYIFSFGSTTPHTSHIRP